jgi:hypothetical protein
VPKSTFPPVPRPSPVEPHLDLVPSVIWDGKRWRAIFNRLYYRPQSETFHEFLIDVIKWTFGKNWWKRQVSMPEDERHVVVKWTFQYADLTRRAERNSSGPPFAAPANGPVWALLSLCYDLFCLQAKGILPEFVVDRLRKKAAFQGARYELAAAAIMMRSGFDVRFLDDKEHSERHCDFIAIHRATGVRVGVEAKSRIRPGVVHEPGNFLLAEDARGLENLIRKARSQRPADLAFIIFVDLNLPSSSTQRVEDRPWYRDALRVIDRLEPVSAESPDPFTALVLTNFSFHYGSASEPVPRPEWGLILSRYPCKTLDQRYIEVIIETLGRYSRIPDEV